MAPPQLSNSTIVPTSTGIIEDSNLYLGSNVAVKNTTEGFITNYLPITTASVLNAGAGLNINKDGDSAAITLRSTGAIDTVGGITASGDITTASTAWAHSLNIHNGKATISDTGLTTISDDLVIGTTVYITEDSGKIHTDGDIETDSTLFVGSTINSVGTVTIGNADSSMYNIQLMNTGEVTAKGNLYIGSNADSDKFEVFAATGNMHTQGTAQIDSGLTVGDDKFIVDSATGDVTQQGSLSITSGGSDRFTVSGSTGDVYALGDLTIGADAFVVTASSGATTQQGDLTVSTKFSVNASTGDIVAHNKFTLKDGAENTKFVLEGADITMGTTGGEGKIRTSYNNYVKPNAYTDVLNTTDVDGILTSSTSDILTTQAYVDEAIWQQTKRINRIVGDNDITSATFTNLFNMAQTLAGNDAVQTLSGLLDTTGEIKTSISTVMNRAYNPVAVNCAPSVWIEECPPMPIPKAVSGIYGLYGLDGWYFRNLSLATMGPSKINWFVPANGFTMKVKHITNLFLNMYAISNKSLPFITMITAPKGNDTDVWPTLANAITNFYFSASSPSATAKKPYTLYTGNAEPANCYNTNKLRCFTTSTKNATNATANSGLGTITSVSSSTPFLSSFDTSIVSGDDIVISFAIQTASTAAASDVNMVVNSLCVESHDTTSDDSRDKINGTTKFMFSNASVATNYQYNYFQHVHMDFTPIDGTKSREYFDAYTAICRA